MGLREVLQKPNRQPLRVAIICSGTESPLLALEMVQDALKSLGEPEMQVDHLFSAEIVPYKQAYIERNFHPKIIFRDITEIMDAIHDAIPTATTVYKEISKARQLTEKVNALAKGLLITVLSERHISNVQRICDSSALTSCDSESRCSDGKLGQRIVVLALCGHRVCQQRHETAREQHPTQWAALGCSASRQDHHLL